MVRKTCTPEQIICRLREAEVDIVIRGYPVPIPLLGKLAEAIIVKMNDQEGDLMMAHLRTRFMMANH